MIHDVTHMSLAATKPVFGWSATRQTSNKPGPEVIKLISCSSSLSMKFIMIINVKMPKTVVFTFISIVNTTSESWKARMY